MTRVAANRSGRPSWFRRVLVACRWPRATAKPAAVGHMNLAQLVKCLAAKGAAAKWAAVWLGLSLQTTAWTQALLELNLANQAQLEMLGGIGPRLSEQLLAARQQRPFKHWADLIQRTQGLGPVRASQLSAKGLRVNGLAFDEPLPAVHGASVSGTALGKPVHAVERPASSVRSVNSAGSGRQP